MFKAQIIYNEIDTGFTVRLLRKNRCGVYNSAYAPYYSDKVFDTRMQAEAAAKRLLTKLAV